MWANIFSFSKSKQFSGALDMLSFLGLLRAQKYIAHFYVLISFFYSQLDCKLFRCAWSDILWCTFVSYEHLQFCKFFLMRLQPLLRLVCTCKVCCSFFKRNLVLWACINHNSGKDFDIILLWKVMSNSKHIHGKRLNFYARTLGSSTPFA